ncbi:hypothetical protein GALMADRAFT_102444 [Galerina marginata CBS 339.88]|uniref:Fungal-type protein kinase domain-containing protein n=1 Tax=Galerina marginata (strain CBS 339.88) TaxID=685588 RepID=A0A067SUV9_GALM3|nr:hypothetical protein GALMADRAFT_102444 [Galerina marginata CBS 339.88]
MPFPTDSTWPAGLLTIFEICRREQPPLENRYYGPYNKLLSYCFNPNTFEYFITQHSLPNTSSSHDTLDSIVFVVVYDARRRPLLIADIQDDSWADRANLRLKADAHMRQYYDAMLADCPIPRLWGLSLLGTSLRVYCGDVHSGQLQPEFENRPSRNHTLPRGFLLGSWSMDILSQEGFTKMQAIVADILANVAALRRDELG